MLTGFTALRPVRFVAALAAAVLVVTGLSLVPATSAQAAGGNVTGTVFRDFNANGRMDTGAAALTGVANDTGLADVTVTAYDNLNAVVGTTTSAANGLYTLNAVNAATNALRIEFTGLPAGFTETAAYGTAAGTRTGTAVQFTTIGSANVNFAAAVSSEYAQAAAPLVTAIQSSGAPDFVVPNTNPASTASTSSANPAVVAAPYTASYAAGTENSKNSTTPNNGTTAVAPFADRKTLATFGQVGSVWGTVYRPSGNDIFVSATYKRHSGLGSLGIGGIYRISNVLAADGTIATPAAANVTAWLNVAAAPLNINVGTAQSNATRGLGASNASAYDTDGFAKVGKIGIGGMALSADGKTLYFINLFDKSLYAIDITNLNSPSVISITPLGLAANERAWALSIYKDQVYVGSVTTGETLAGGAAVANPGRSATQSAMTATVRRTNLPLSNASTFTTVLNQASLGYAKGDVYNNVLSTAAFNGQSHQWNSWTDTWSWTANGGGSVAEANGGWHIYPQPILSGLYFDEGGYLSLGFSDRSAIQGGNRNFAAVTTGSTAHYETGASGDILIAAPNATQSSWTLESNGVSGTRTATTQTAAQGPGGFEFYNDRLNVGQGTTHQETALGALAGLHGTREVIATSYDPNNGIRLAGTSWFNTVNGANIAGYEHTADPGGSTVSTSTGTFQKGGGLGAVQLLAKAAPIEIGNRVWFDADQDGLQDADEPALAGVTVELYKVGTATPIKSVTTGADGSYYFSSDSSSAYFAGAAFTPNGGDYTIKFTTPTTGNAPLAAATFGTVPWSTVSLTSNGNASTLAGSDPDPVTGVYAFTAGDPGTANHDVDAGFRASAVFTVQKIISNAGGPAATGQSFSISAAKTDFRGNAAGTNAFTLAGGATSAKTTVPVGTLVTVTESGTTTYRSVAVSPSAATLVTGTTATPTNFTVTNELRDAGRFRITKLVTGTAANSVASTQSFTVNYTYPGLATPGTLTVTKGGTTALSDPIPYGATVTLSELTPTGAPADVQWGTPTWAQVAAQSNGTVTSNADGTASIVINDIATLNINLTNPTTRLFGDFSITKAVTGNAAASVPGTFQFTAQYSIDGGTTWTNVTLTKNAPTVTVTGVPAGTTVLLRETTPGTAAADVEFGTPVFSGDATSTPTGGTVVIAAGTTKAVILTNPTTRKFGSFSITKAVTGGAAGSVPGDFEFTAQYSTDGGTTWTNVTLSKNAPTQSITGIPAGTTVLVRETTPGNAAPDVQFGTPVFSGDATSTSTGGTFVVAANVTRDVILTNPTTVKYGSFSITKSVTGAAAASVPGTFQFTVQYSIDGGTTWTNATVSKNAPTTTITGIRAGTTVLVRETTPGSAAPDVQFGTPVFSGDATSTPTGGTFVIAANTTSAVALENPTTRKFGTFSLTKSVTGGGEDVLTAGKKFSITYTYPGLATPVTVQLENGETHTSGNIPLGTEVTVTEATPTGGLPAGAAWGTPRLVIGGTPQANGSTITIGTQSNLALTVENPTTVTPLVTITKSDSLGNAADTMPAGQFYAPGSSRAIEITLVNTGTEDLKNVTFSDTTVSGADITGLSFMLPDGTPLVATQTAGSWTAVWDDTFSPHTSVWKRGQTVTGTATFAAVVTAQPHVDRAAVTGVGVHSNSTITRANNYNAFTGAIQVIEYDGDKADPAVKDGDGNWITPTKPLADADQDANDNDHAVEYPNNTDRTVRWVVTNTSTTSLTNVTLTSAELGDDWTADLREFGGDQFYSFVDDGPFAGILPPGASFFATATTRLAATETLSDLVAVVATVVVPAANPDGTLTGGPSMNGSGHPIVALTPGGAPVTVNDNDPFNAFTGTGPRVDIEKGDGTGTTIAHDADTMLDGTVYTPGQSRTIVYTVENTGDEKLNRVTLTDTTTAGADVTGITWTFPDGSTAAAVKVAGVWTATWPNTFTGVSTWAPDALITGVATLAIPLTSQPHASETTVVAYGAGSNIAVDDADQYNAFTGGIQVIEYDGNKADPAVTDADGDWVTPTKPLTSAAQDANTTATAVEYPVNTERTVRWVVTNTSTTALTNLTLTSDELGDDWTADLGAFGGPADYSFTEFGAWPGILPAGASFFATAKVTLPANAVLSDLVAVTATVVVPGTEATPVTAVTVDGDDFVVNDDDPFNAFTAAAPKVDIEKGDGTGTTIAHDADTMAAGTVYTPGQSRTIVYTVENTGGEKLDRVTLTDTTTAGADVTGITWTFPDGTTADAVKVAGVWTATWPNTFTGVSTWAPDAVITGVATLTVPLSSAPHVSSTAVEAFGLDSDIKVTDADAYNAFTGGIQVIEYDGEKTDPSIGSAPAWVIPTKPLTSASQDANTTATAVEYPVNTERTVRWVVSNTGTTSLTSLDLTSAELGDDWTADLREFGGDQFYSFVDDGPFTGILPAGASFFATATVTLPANTVLSDLVSVDARVLVPGTSVGAVTVDGDPFIVSDTDPFNAFTVAAPKVDIEKGDGSGTTIAHDADTVAEGTVYTPGQSRTIVYTVENTGGEKLDHVTLTDETTAGADVTGITWTFPDGSTAEATKTAGVWTATWPNTFTGVSTWAPDAVITGVATLAIPLTAQPHVSETAVEAFGIGSGTRVTDADQYNAFTGGIQVIEYDGSGIDPAVSDADGNWVTPAKPLASAAQDANTTGTAVTYPVNTERTVRWVVTNTGTTDLTNLDLTSAVLGDDWTADLREFGGDQFYSFVDDGPFTGILPAGTSFFATAKTTLPANSTLSDLVAVEARVLVPGTSVGAVTVDGDPFVVSDDDPFNAKTGVGPKVDIEKGDGTGTTIAHDADTMANGVAYTPGQSRTIVYTVENTGDENLTRVTLTDETTAGADVTGITWTFPDGSTANAVKVAGVWTAEWPNTFTGVSTWAPDALITGVATLAVPLSSEPHVSETTVVATGADSGIDVDDADQYNAFTGGIQVIEYDGQKADPAVTDGDDNWITPTKPLDDADQDANDTDHAVEYPVNTNREVRFVVTNTGTTALTNLDLTSDELGDDWTADLRDFGGPQFYSFVVSGPWPGVLPAGASFFATATVQLAATETLGDLVEVVATVVVPGTEAAPVAAVTVDGDPFTVNDNDPFNAFTGVGPRVNIEKGDGTAATIANDADTMLDGEAYTPGETRTVVFTVTNTGDEDLERVTVSDETLSGARVTALTWTFPDGTTATATEAAGIWSATWADTFTGDAVWAPDDVITGTATIVVLATDQPHVDRASAQAYGVDSGIRVGDSDDYNAVTGAVQVIKYDGETPDPAVKNAAGEWIIPSKDDVAADVDADTDANAVVVKPNTKRTIRWVVTNTGTTALTHLDVEDITLSGTPIDANWTADLSPLGGPAKYSFVKSGPWDGVFLPGQSFFSEGSYTLAPFAGHADDVKVIADIIVPEVDDDGVPTGNPMIDDSGNPVLLRDNAGVVRTVDGGDPFTARAASLAITGVDPMAALWAALALLLGGMALMVLAPKRRRKH